MLTTTSGRQQLEKDFNTCEPIDDDDVYYFKLSISLELGGSDQMDNPPHVCFLFLFLFLFLFWVLIVSLLF